MLKRTLVLILAGCLMLCTASFAEKEPDVSDAVNGIVYEDECLTMRLGQIISEEDSVTVTITFENSGTRYCAVMAGITKEMMEDDALKVLRLMQQINGGEFARTIAPKRPLRTTFPGIQVKSILNLYPPCSVQTCSRKRLCWRRKVIQRIRLVVSPFYFVTQTLKIKIFSVPSKV